MAPESGGADATLVENQTEAVEAAYAAAAPPMVRRGPPPPHRVYPQTTASACSHTLLSTTARTVAAGPLYGSRHTRMCVSSLAEAVALS